MEKHGLLDREEYLKRLAENENNVELVNYPLEKLEFNRRVNKLNVLMISVNNLRADALNQEEMPNLYELHSKIKTSVNTTAQAMTPTVHLACSMVYQQATPLASRHKVPRLYFLMYLKIKATPSVCLAAAVLKMTFIQKSSSEA